MKTLLAGFMVLVFLIPAFVIGWCWFYVKLGFETGEAKAWRGEE